MMDLLSKLCAMDGVSSFEHSVRAFLRAEAEKHAEQILEDRLGNLLVFRRGHGHGGRTVMLAAHMDEVGFIIKGFTDDGFIKFGTVGGIDRKILLGTRVRVGARALPGVIGIKAVHMSSPEERKKLPKIQDMYIDIGTSSKAEAEALCALGEPIAFDASAPAAFGDGLFRAKAIDDRLGCAVLLTLLREGPAVDTWFAFTVQEETGLRGAAAAAYRIRPDIAVVVEGTTAADLPDVVGARRACRVGAGAVMPAADGASIYDAGLLAHAKAVAQRAGIPCQPKTYIAGGTDAGRIGLTAGGSRLLAISAPVRYLHSPVSVVSTADAQAVLDLTCAFINSLEGNDIV